MPELGEVAHAASILRRFLCNKVLKSISTVEDPLVYAKPLTHTEFKSKLENLKVSDVGRHGKYFWLRFDSSPLVLLLHFGMTGWIKVKGIETHFVVMENGGDKVAAERIKKEKEQGKNFANDNDGIIIAKDDMEWPPKYHKFILTADDGTQVAFTDPRRLGRIRILEASTEEKLMKLEPLKKLGIDYSNPQGRLDLEKFSKEVLRRNPPIKALLMDQAVFSGVGNWVADEICYQARLHPETVCSSLSQEQVRALYDKVIDICTFVVKVEGNTSKFPEDWLMLYRWGKRRKNEKATTKEGYAVDHITVGGRTSCFVPELQKKAGNTTESATKKRSSKKKSTPRAKKVKKEEEEEEDDGFSEEEEEEEAKPPPVKTRSGRMSKRS